MLIQMRAWIGYTEMIITKVDVQAKIHFLRTYQMLHHKVYNVMFLPKFTLCLFNIYIYIDIATTKR